MNESFVKMWRVIRTTGFVLMACGIGALLLQNQDLSSALNKRSPTLDYLECHDKWEDDLEVKRDRTDYLKTVTLNRMVDILLSNGELGADDETLTKRRREWLANAESVAKDSAEGPQCPDLPD